MTGYSSSAPEEAEMSVVTEHVVREQLDQMQREVAQRHLAGSLRPGHDRRPGAAVPWWRRLLGVPSPTHPRPA
jgi:hypothetical protein